MRFANVVKEGDFIPNGLSFNARMIETSYVDERDACPMPRRAVIFHFEIILRLGTFMTCSRWRLLWRLGDVLSGLPVPPPKVK